MTHTLVRRWPRLLLEVVLPVATWTLVAVLVAPHDDGVSWRGAVVHDPPPLEESVYVWQRDWNDAVRDAVRDHGPTFASVIPLAAELTLSERGLEQVVDPIESWNDEDWSALRSSSAVGLALRIRPYRGRPRADGAAVRALVHAARRTVTLARGHGVELTELQLDFDAAESQLEVYARWVSAVRAAIAPTRLTITALPSWLDRSAYIALADAADGVVLQVHGLERPRNPDALPRIIESGRCRRWIERAAALGRPFRIALPTYGYRVAFRPGDDALLAVEAESPRRSWPAGTTLVLVEPDATAIGAFVRQLQLARPQELVGIAWYRLPVRGDRFNWPWSTLAAVRSGRSPAPSLRVEMSRLDSGIGRDVLLVNDGEAPSPLPLRMRLTLPPRAEGTLSTRPVVESRGGYAQLDEGASVVLELRDSALHERLEPNARRRVAWIAGDSTPEISIDALSP